MNTAISPASPGIPPGEESHGAFAGLRAGLPQFLYYAILFTIPFYTYASVAVGSGLLGLGAFLLLLGQGVRNYNRAAVAAREQKDDEMLSLVEAYRLAYVSVLVYFLIKSGLDHKMFLLALPLSQIGLLATRQIDSGRATSQPSGSTPEV